MSVVGTAGHVDHGKSTLLQALTGRDPDRWEEEKRRGLTIDLGFVWTTLPSGREVSFVDVPGHRRFIKNMLAGIESVDAALFVVAADEGWMPQSEEHLAVLDLIGIDRAVVALTKSDRVDADLLELAQLEVADHLDGTSLAGSEIVAVSARNGTGLEALARALDGLLGEPSTPTSPRLWIDRRFTVAGAGSVVTGTLLGGPVSVGDELMAYPAKEIVRVRGVESHEAALDRVEPHRRVALNVVADTELHRGTMLGLANRWEPTSRLTATLRAARYTDELTDRGAYQVHVGTAAVSARLRTLGNSALLTLDEPLPLRYGDRFIVRETGRRAVVAGGVVLDPSPPRRGKPLRTSAELAASLSPTEAADALLAIRGTESVERLVAQTGGPPAAELIHGDVAMAPREAERLRAIAEDLVDEFHRSSPLRPGMAMATLAAKLGISIDLAEWLLSDVSTLEVEGAVVCLRGHASTLSPHQERNWEASRQKLEAGNLMPPALAELALDTETLHELMRRGELVRISQEFAYLPEAAERLREAIGSMPDGFTVADFRDAVVVSRKYAVPILEWADEVGLTRRTGDLRSPVHK